MSRAFVNEDAGNDRPDLPERPVPPGPNFVTQPIAPPPGASMALHIDMNGKAIAFVWVAEGHGGQAFVEDSWLWWNAHAANPTGPHSASFQPPSPVLRLVPSDPPAGASGEG
ncbi:MAG: hypothetical protein V4583_07490 [Pseudomonadota bacterium]